LKKVKDFKEITEKYFAKEDIRKLKKHLGRDINTGNLKEWGSDISCIPEIKTKEELRKRGATKEKADELYWEAKHKLIDEMERTKK